MMQGFISMLHNENISLYEQYQVSSMTRTIHRM